MLGDTLTVVNVYLPCDNMIMLINILTVLGSCLPLLLTLTVNTSLLVISTVTPALRLLVVAFLLFFVPMKT